MGEWTFFCLPFDADAKGRNGTTSKKVLIK